jgi:transposase
MYKKDFMKLQANKPHILDSESDPRILRDLAKMMESEIKRLNGVIQEIQAEKAKQAQAQINFSESLGVLRKKYFGRSIETDSKTRRRNRQNDDPELTLHSQNLLPPPDENSLRDLASEEVLHDIDPNELKEMSASLEIDKPAADQWEEVPGLFDKSTEITIIERIYKKLIHKRKKYRLKKEFAPPEKHVIIAAPSPVKLVPGATYSIDFAVSVLVDKYLNHLPLERQCRSMDSLGLTGMSTQVLYNVCRLAGEHLEIVAERIKMEVLSHPLIHSDETPWPINSNKDSDGYLWIISNNAGTYYRFEPTRSGKVIKETLKDFNGIVMSDAYAGYYQFRKQQKQKLVLCHAHARRKFWDIKETSPVSKEILDLWEELFKLEYTARNFNELREIRNEKSRKIIAQMKDWLWLKLPEARGESELKKAINYSLKHWVELTKFLDDPIIPLTNNEAERSIRQAVLGRKNFYGSRSIDGADLAAIIYTLIESCKKVELDPREYLLTTIKLAAAGLGTETPYEMAKRQRQ